MASASSEVVTAPPVPIQVPAEISKFFKNRKKNPELFFFSKDGSVMVSKDKGGQEATIPFTQFTPKTSEELLASYEQRAQAIKEQQELFDVAMRALLDARERGASDFELLALNRECQRLDSYLFELNWAEKEMKVADPVPEFRQLEFTNPYLVNKPKEPVYIFTARRVTVDFPYKYELLSAATTVAAGADAAAVTVAVPLPPAVLERASIATGATETRRLDGEEPIEFYYKLENPYKVFSSSYSAAFSLDGKVWPTVIHYFQAQKFPSDPVYQETIRTSKRPEEAKKLGKTIDRPIRPDFELYMDDIMRRALAAKFEQNPPLKKLLTDTGNKTLIDVDPTDPYWGMGKDRKGKNKLGQMLMELRDKFRTEAVGAAVAAAAPAAPASVSVVAENPRLTAAAIPKGTKVRISSRPPPVPAATASATAAAAAATTTESIT